MLEYNWIGKFCATYLSYNVLAEWFIFASIDQAKMEIKIKHARLQLNTRKVLCYLPFI